MKPSILVVGSINMDLFIKTPTIPLLGENVFGSDLQVLPGGKGANQAMGIARLGCRAMLSGRVGTDQFGDSSIENLRENGVDVALVEHDPEVASGIAIVLIDPNGENRIVIATGANGRFSRESAAKLDKVLPTVDLVLLQLELPLDPVAGIIEAARRCDKPVVLDAGPPCKEPRPSFFKVTVLSPNEAEAQALSGRSISGLESARQVARYLLHKGPGAVVLKLGERGSILVTHDREKHFPAHKVPVVDTSVAGDAFSAALSVAMAQGKNLEEAVEFANAAGALAATKVGAQRSLPTLRELEGFMGRKS